jgi:hypothetical protein
MHMRLLVIKDIDILKEDRDSTLPRKEVSHMELEDESNKFIRIEVRKN